MSTVLGNTTENTEDAGTGIEVTDPEELSNQTDSTSHDDGNQVYPEFEVKDMYIMDYWHSNEASKLFGKLPEEKSALEAIHNQMKTLTEAIGTSDGYENIVQPSIDSGANDAKDLFLKSLSEHQIYMVRHKCQSLMMTLNLVTKCMDQEQNFDSCCQYAIELLKAMGLPAPKNSRTIRNWYRSCRLHDRKIVVPFLPKKNKPLFLTEFPEKAIIISDYAKSNLATLSGEMMSQYIHGTILPQIVKEEYQVDNTDESYDGKLEMVCSLYFCTITVVTP
jgi:hypothetical protein